MFRLWWKDLVQFRPVWLALVAVAAAGQWLAVRYGPADWRHGGLILLAVGWAGLYAVAVASAAFAGERETGTLALLDTLPVGRGVLWGGKATFATFSTAALALVLVGMAMLSTTRWDDRQFGPPLMGLVFASLLMEALGWGLLFSSRSATALHAAVATLGAFGATEVLLASWYQYGNDPSRTVDLAGPRLALAGLAVAASAWRMTAPPRVGRVRRAWRWRAPLVRETAPVPAAGVESPRWSRTAEIRALAWQTFADGWRTWWVLVGLAVGFPVVLGMLGRGLISPLGVVLFGATAGLIGGLVVFNHDYRGGAQRFLAYQGARPGLVWGTKLFVWALALSPLFFPAVSVVAVSEWSGEPGGRTVSEVSTAALVLGFAVGQLAGMVFRRGITAAVIGTVAWLALTGILGGLADHGLMTLPLLLTFPLAFLALSRLWCGDWLLDRPGAARWVKLGALAAAAAVTLSAVYVATRAWGVREIAALPQPRGWDTVAQPVDAAPLYRAASGRLTRVDPGGVDTVIRDGFAAGGPRGEVADWLRANADPLREVREAAARPYCRPEGAEAWDLRGTPPGPDFFALARLVAVDARDRQARGDLAGAWDDVRTLLVLRDHAFQGATLRQALHALYVERHALGLALAWAADPKQTPALIRKARDEYLTVPSRPELAEVVRAEAALAERTLALGKERLRELVIGVSAEGRPRSAAVDPTEAGRAGLITTPWEVTRARRVLRLLNTAEAEQSRYEPYQRLASFWTPTWPHLIDPGTNRVLESSAALEADFQTSPLARTLMPTYETLFRADDLNEAVRRGLTVVLALRAWQLDHGGKLPKSLGQVEQQENIRLPRDPFSNQAFGYEPSDGQALPPPGAVFEPWEGRGLHAKAAWGLRVVFSVGPDGVSNQARSLYPEGPMGPRGRAAGGDIAFVLPPEPGWKPGPPPGEPGPPVLPSAGAGAGMGAGPTP